MEKIYTLQTDKISSIIEGIGFTASDFMVLEKIDRIKFEKFKPETFEDWEKGIIFSKDKEFKWRRIEDKFYIVFSGEDIPLPDGFKEPQGIDIKVENSPVILWGQRSDKMQDFPKNHYIELPIPKALEYPIESNFRVKIRLRIQKSSKGEIIGYRFSGLNEEAYHESV